MAFTIRNLIAQNPPLVTIKPDESVREAIRRMNAHDFSQLPVVNDEKHALGVITSESILQAISQLAMPLEELKVSHAMSNDVTRVGPDEDVLSIQDKLVDRYAALVVDRDNVIVGVVTNFDTAAYFRGRAEALMLIQDIESLLKDHIESAFNYEQTARDQAVQRVSRKTSGLGVEEFKSAIAHYVQLRHGIAEVDELALVEAFAKLPAERGRPKTFDLLSLDELIGVLIDGGAWESYKYTFGDINKDALRKNLQQARSIRNDLAHFKRELAAEDYERLRWTVAFIQRHPKPTRVTTIPLVEPTTTSIVADTLGPDVLIDVSADDRETKYSALAIHLREQPSEVDTLKLSFVQIEEVIGAQLPITARKHASWWANDSVGHVQSKQWLDADWRVANVSFELDTVTFERMIERERAYIAFYKQLLADVKRHAKFKVSAYEPNGANWITVGGIAGRSHYLGWLNFAFARGGRFRSEIYIDTLGYESTKDVFKYVQAQQSDIEAQFGAPLSWELLPNRRASRIAVYHTGSIQDTDDEKLRLRDWAVGAINRMATIVAPRVSKVMIELGL